MGRTFGTRVVGRSAVAALALAASLACASRPQAPQAPQTTQANVATGPGGDRQGRMMAMLFEGITLSPGQQASIDSIRADFRSRMAPSQQGGDRSQMRQAMEQQRTAIRNVLTPDQQRIFDANMEKMRQERGRGRGGRSS